MGGAVVGNAHCGGAVQMPRRARWGKNKRSARSRWLVALRSVTGVISLSMLAWRNYEGEFLVSIRNAIFLARPSSPRINAAETHLPL